MSKSSNKLNAERALVLSSIIICLVLWFSQLLPGIDQRIYDLSMPFISAQDTQSMADIALVTVDDKSIEHFGRWPWKRDIHASLLEKLNQASPRFVVVNFLFSEQDHNAEREHLNTLRTRLQDTGIFNHSAVPDKPDTDAEYSPGDGWLNPDFIAKNPTNQKRLKYVDMQKSMVDSLTNLDKYLAEITARGSGDQKLSRAIQGSAPVLMPMYFYPNKVQKVTTPEYVTENSATFLVQGSFSTKRENLPPNMESVIYPIADFGEHSSMLGHTNEFLDSDGRVRSHALLLHHNGQLYPSLALSAAAAYLGYSRKDILYQPGGGVILGQRKYPTDENLTVLPVLNPQPNLAKPFELYSYMDVLSGTVSAERLRNKIVIVGITANRLSTRYKTSSKRYVSPSELLAFNIANLAKMRFYHTPALSKAVTWLLFGLVAIGFFIVSSRISMKRWVILTLALTALTFLLQLTALKFMQIWLPLAPLYTLYALGFLLVNLWKLGTSEKASFQNQIESSKNSRVLGLTYQNQGQLDLAFDTLKRCTPDASIADALYGLGLDFERKRLNHKACLVYRYIESISPSFKDVTDRIDAIENNAPSASEHSSKSDSVTVQRSNHAPVLERPTFGRYQIEREIGKGGMGAVYLGKDPKINRSVAIKTLNFSAEFSGDLLVEAKKRFAREAMAAGKLNHRNIVTIYDAGEDHDLAYIAMEYVDGMDLSSKIKAGSLLPLKEIIRIGIFCADALDYAHKLGVVHRDIKPANIIYQRETRNVWLTDFGIALIIGADITRTSSTIGSPSYMSPEQIKGEALDGRSDIYSLGVTLYQLIAAQLPYVEEGAPAITYAIVNNPTPNLAAIKKNIPADISEVIYTSMRKDKQLRYASAGEMRDALRACFNAKLK